MPHQTAFSWAIWKVSTTHGKLRHSGQPIGSLKLCINSMDKSYVSTLHYDFPRPETVSYGFVWLIQLDFFIFFMSLSFDFVNKKEKNKQTDQSIELLHNY